MINKFGADSRNFFFWHFLFIIGDPHNHFIGRPQIFAGDPKHFIGLSEIPSFSLETSKLIIWDSKLLIGDPSLLSETPNSSLETQAYHQRPQAHHWRHKLIIRDPLSSSLETQAFHRRPSKPSHWRPLYFHCWTTKCSSETPRFSWETPSFPWE